MTKDKNDLPKLLRIKDAAEMLGVHPATLRRWDDEGQLKAVRIGSRAHPFAKNKNVKGDRRYRLQDIQVFIKDKSEAK